MAGPVVLLLSPEPARGEAGEILGVDDPVDEAVRQATFELAACYRAVERSQPMATFSRRFATLWVALEDQDPAHFHIKPKLHLFQELCEMEPQGRPVTHATYREEEFGGSVAALGRRLGGHNTPSSVGVQTLLKFRARHQLPAIGDDGGVIDHGPQPMEKQSTTAHASSKHYCILATGLI